MNVESMISDNEKLVYSIANTLYKENQYYSQEDLAQVGFLALCKNGNKYDRKRGKISTFIHHCVRNDMLKYIKSHIKFKAQPLTDDESYEVNFDYSQEDLSALVKTKTPLEEKIVRAKADGMTHKEISDDLKISQNQVSKILRTVKTRMEKMYA